MTPKQRDLLVTLIEILAVLGIIAAVLLIVIARAG